jgi:hypothetical protein
LYLCGMLRRGDQEGAGFLSNPVRRGNNGIRAPTQHAVRTHKLNENSDDDFDPSTELNQPAGGLPVLIAA